MSTVSGVLYNDIGNDGDTALDGKAVGVSISLMYPLPGVGNWGYYTAVSDAAGAFSIAGVPIGLYPWYVASPWIFTEGDATWVATHYPVLLVSGDIDVGNITIRSSQEAIMGDGLFGGNVTPASLSGSSAGEITLGSGGEYTLQAVLHSHNSAEVHFRVLQATGQTASTDANTIHFLSHGGSCVLRLPAVPGVTWYLYWFICDNAGTAVTGGAADYLKFLLERT